MHSPPTRSFSTLGFSHQHIHGINSTTHKLITLSHNVLMQQCIIAVACNIAHNVIMLKSLQMPQLAALHIMYPVNKGNSLVIGEHKRKKEKHQYFNMFTFFQNIQHRIEMHLYSCSDSTCYFPQNYFSVHCTGFKRRLFGTTSRLAYMSTSYATDRVMATAHKIGNLTFPPCYSCVYTETRPAQWNIPTISRKYLPKILACELLFDQKLLNSSPWVTIQTEVLVLVQI